MTGKKTPEHKITVRGEVKSCVSGFRLDEAWTVGMRIVAASKAGKAGKARLAGGSGFGSLVAQQERNRIDRLRIKGNGV